MTSENLPPSPGEVVEQVEPLIRALPAEKREEIRHVLMRAISYQGPLPPPQMLAEYGVVVPDAPERILRQLEKQTDHRIAMERTMIEGQVGSVARGQWMAFWLSVIFGVIALVLGILGHEILAGVIAGTTIVGLATVFVLGRRAVPPASGEEDEEEDEDAEPNPPARQQRKRRR